jgi:DNA polymerase-3 subunit delta
MMSSRRVVLIKDVQDLDEKEWSAITSHLKSLTETHLMVLTGGKLDRRKKSVKEAIDLCETIEYKKPFDNQIPGWVMHIGKSLGLDIDSEVAQLMAHQSSGALFEIDLDLKKLKDFILPRTQVRKEDLAQCLDRRKEESIFELIDRLAHLDTVSAFQKWMDLTLNGQSEVAVVSLLARHLRILAKLKQGQTSGFSGPKLAAYAQVPPFYLKDYLDQLKNWPLKRIAQSLELLADTDKALKSSPVSNQLWIENLIFKITESPKS